MEKDPHTIPVWHDHRFIPLLRSAAATFVGSRLVLPVRLHGRLWLIVGVLGALYGYLMELDDRRKGHTG